MKEQTGYCFRGVKGSRLALGMSLISCQCCGTRSDFSSAVYSLAAALRDDGGQPPASAAPISHQPREDDRYA